MMNLEVRLVQQNCVKYHVHATKQHLALRPEDFPEELVTNP